MNKTSFYLLDFMPDTIGISGHWMLKQPLDNSLWDVTTFSKKVKDREVVMWRANYKSLTSLVLTGFAEPKKCVAKIECSLPALLHGYNGRIFGENEEFRNSIDKLKKFIEATLSESCTKPIIHRFDCSWQFLINAVGVISAYERVKLKSGRKLGVVVPDQSILWKLRNSALQIYEKTAQMRRKGLLAPKDQTVLRFELQLRSRQAVALAFNNADITLDDLSLEKSYYALRAFVVQQLPDIKKFDVDAKLFRKAELLAVVAALCAASEQQIGKESVISFIQKRLVPSAARKFRREVAALKLGQADFSFDKMFPERFHKLKGINILEDGRLEEIEITDPNPSSKFSAIRNP